MCLFIRGASFKASSMTSCGDVGAHHVLFHGHYRTSFVLHLQHMRVLAEKGKGDSESATRGFVKRRYLYGAAEKHGLRVNRAGQDSGPGRGSFEWPLLNATYSTEADVLDR